MTRSLVSWLAGATLFLFLWWVGGALLGADLASWVFTPIAAVLLVRQFLRWRRSRVTLRDAD